MSQIQMIHQMIKTLMKPLKNLFPLDLEGDDGGDSDVEGANCTRE